VFDAIVTPEILRKVTGAAHERYPLERHLGSYDAWLFTPDPLRFATIVRRKAMRGLYVFAMLPSRLHRTSAVFSGSA
jgi:hypothetical protein